jgi:hypothetical protein
VNMTGTTGDYIEKMIRRLYRSATDADFVTIGTHDVDIDATSNSKGRTSRD